MAKARITKKYDENQWQIIEKKIEPLTISDLKAHYTNFLLFFNELQNDFSLNLESKINIPDLSERYTENLLEDLLGEFLQLIPSFSMVELLRHDKPLSSFEKSLKEVDIKKNLNAHLQNKFLKELPFIYRLIMLNSVCFLNHRLTMQELIQNAKSGNDEAFFQAISIDKSLITSEWITQRIRKESFSDNKNFFDSLSLALRKDIKSERQGIYIKLELFFYMICSNRLLGKLSDPEFCLIIHDWDIAQVNPEQIRQFRNRYGFKKKTTNPSSLSS